MTDHGGHGGSSKTIPACRACAANRRVIQREAQLNNRRLDVGRPVDLSLIERSKRAIQACTDNGHGLRVVPDTA